jgi:hypothetical protein
LTAASQFPPGEITLKGWLRKKTVLFVEVGEARSEKTQRNSLVKTLRWVIAWVVVLVGLGLLMSADAGY